MYPYFSLDVFVSLGKSTFTYYLRKRQARIIAFLHSQHKEEAKNNVKSYATRSFGLDITVHESSGNLKYIINTARSGTPHKKNIQEEC